MAWTKDTSVHYELQPPLHWGHVRRCRWTHPPIHPTTQQMDFLSSSEKALSCVNPINLNMDFVLTLRSRITWLPHTIDRPSWCDILMRKFCEIICVRSRGRSVVSDISFSVGLWFMRSPKCLLFIWLFFSLVSWNSRYLPASRQEADGGNGEAVAPLELLAAQEADICPRGGSIRWPETPQLGVIPGDRLFM